MCTIRCLSAHRVRCGKTAQFLLVVGEDWACAGEMRRRCRSSVFIHYKVLLCGKDFREISPARRNSKGCAGRLQPRHDLADSASYCEARDIETSPSIESLSQCRNRKPMWCASATMIARGCCPLARPGAQSRHPSATLEPYDRDTGHARICTWRALRRLVALTNRGLVRKRDPVKRAGTPMCEYPNWRRKPRNRSKNRGARRFAARLAQINGRGL